jgi:peptide/nickel transport system substrate-binding protein
VGKSDAAKTSFADPRLRTAFALAIDRQAITDVVFNGEFLPGNQWVSPRSPYYQESLPVPARDVAKAKALLAEAGVKTPVIIDLMVPNNPELRQVAEVIQSMAGEAGFDLRIRVTELATSLKEAEEGRYQAYLLNWSGRIDPDGNTYSFLKTGAPENRAGFSDPEVDALLEESRVKSSLAERKAVYRKIAEKVIDRGGIIYIYHRLIIVARTDKVEGYKQIPDGLVRLAGVRLK